MSTNPKQKVFYQPGPLLLGSWIRYKLTPNSIYLVTKYSENGFVLNKETWPFSDEKDYLMNHMEYSLDKGNTWLPFYKE
jgi:hypothetical protein